MSKKNRVTPQISDIFTLLLYYLMQNMSILFLSKSILFWNFLFFFLFFYKTCYTTEKKILYL